MKSFIRCALVVATVLSMTSLANAYEYKIGNCLNETIRVQLVGTGWQEGATGLERAGGCTAPTIDVPAGEISPVIGVQGVSAPETCCADHLVVNGSITIPLDPQTFCSPVGLPTIYISKVAATGHFVASKTTCYP